MDTRTIPPMKPVLVTDVSDNIKVLQKDDVTKQRTVLTARAIEDLFKCAPIVKTSDSEAIHPDNAYFTSGGKIDLDRIVTAQSRYLDDNAYINSPGDLGKVMEDECEDDPFWAVNHSEFYMSPPAFLYVFSVQDNSELVWGNYDGKIPMADKLGDNRSAETATDVEFRKVAARAKSPLVKQIYMPLIKEQYLEEDGTKRKYPGDKINDYDRLHRTRYNQTAMWTRLGTLNNATGEYDWEDWHVVGVTHNGPEYFTNITIDADITAISRPLADAIYHVYSVVGTFELPNANLDGYKLGQKIVVEVHPPRNEGDPIPQCRVTYTDTLSRGEDAGRETMSVLITPRARINNKNYFGGTTDEALITSVAAFEIVETKDANGNVYRTWELDAGAEETDFTSGLAQMLGEHTDAPVNDIVHAQDASRSSETSINVLYPVASSGYVTASFLLNEAVSDNTWVATVKIIHPTGEAAFVKASGTPSSDLIYYVRDNNRWSLAENNGHPTSFDPTKEYYSLDATSDRTTTVDVIPAVGDSSVLLVDNQVHLVDLTVGKVRRFIAYATRGSLISVHIYASHQMSQYQGKLYPEVGFLPDPHASYLLKATINPSAFTNKQLQKLFLDGSIVGDIKLASCDELYQGILNAPISTRAVVEAYAYLANKLQAKGALFGNRLVSDANGDEMDTIVHPGRYYVKMPASGAASSAKFPIGFTATNNGGFNLIVLGNDHASVAMIHDEDGLATGADRLVQIGIVYGEPIKISTRVGTKSGSTWTWTAWRLINDWNNIANLPSYFRTRWDMIHSPNGMIDYIDSPHTKRDTANSKPNKIVLEIPDGTVSTLLAMANEDPVPFSSDNNINYEVPTIAVGVNEDRPGVGSLDTEPFQYVVRLRMPDAVETPGLNENTVVNSMSNVRTSSKEQKHRRRRVRIMLHGNPANMTESETPDQQRWRSIGLHLFYCKHGKNIGDTYDNATGQYEFDYQLSWGGVSKGFIDVEMEQIDYFDTTDQKYWRIWAPVTVD